MTVPTGIITMWYGTTGSIPSGWIVCDGANDTPDLRSMFVLGASSDGDVGITGGSLVHNHACPSLSDAGYHRHGVGGTSGGNSTSVTASQFSGVYNASMGHSHSYSGNSGYKDVHSHTVADSEAASSLPPYYKLFYIMKT
jgi:hypothetical protein